MARPGGGGGPGHTYRSPIGGDSSIERHWNLIQTEPDDSGSNFQAFGRLSRNG